MKILLCPALMLFVGLVGCDEHAIDCADQPQWCQDFQLHDPGPVNLALPNPTVTVQLATPDATPNHETHFRVSVEQPADGVGGPAIGGGQMLAATRAQQSWDVPLTNLLDVKSLRCGPAKLYLHARLLSAANPTALVPATDSASAQYLQHGVASFTVLANKPVLFPFQSSGPITGGGGISKLSLHVGMPSSIFATLDEVNGVSVTQLAVGSLSSSNMITNLSSQSSMQLLGETSNVRLIAKQVPDSMNSCKPQSVKLGACTSLTAAADVSNPSKCFFATSTFPWCFPANSLAVDNLGSYFASVDSNEKLFIYNLTITPADKTLAFTEWMPGKYSGYRYVTIGDIDGDGVMDGLALKNGGTPLVLLREAQTFNQSKQAAAMKLATELEKAAPLELKAADSVAVLGSFDRCAQSPGVLVASSGVVQSLTQNADGTFKKTRLTLDSLPPGATITAMLLADTDSNGTSDLLFVAVKPDTVYIYQIQQSP